ncbi:MAG: amylo-alpha-1,6-glucosidase [Tannerellaceae bacterium]|nr:amylo-alpha-1,6-glucosidase [Tannerellaceae bacterium]
MNKHLSLLLMLTGVCFMDCQSTGKPGHLSYPMESISNEGKTKEEPYLTAGDKAHIIGTQNGLFPDMGGHVPGEMGGIWTHPVKLADGYWMKIREEGQQEGVWLMETGEYITYPYGSGFLYNQNDLQVKRFQFAPDQEKGVIIEYTIQNTSGQVRNLFLDFVVKTDLSPVWFSKENGIPDYPDQVIWDTNHQLFSARDSLQEWYMAWGTDNPVLSYETDSPGPERTKGMGKSGLIRTSLQLGAGETQVISYAVSGSLLSKEDAIETYTRLLKEKTKLLHEKQQSLANLLEVSHISLPDKHLENTYNWVRLNTRWLEIDLDGYCRFLGAGAIEYRWLFGCDNSYALQGVLATGDFELAKSTLTMLKNVSEKVNGNGRIIHEMSSNGYVYNKGNTQETAHFIIAVWKTFLWTGDITFLQDLYPYVKKGIHWLTVDMDANQNLFPEGYGIMEVHGLNAELIDVAVYTQQALEAASQMAKLFHEDSVSDAYARQATLLKDKINRDFWDEAEGIYCDFFGTKEQAVSVAKGAIRQLRSGTSDAEKETIRFYESLLTRFHQLPDGTQQGWFTNKNWVITTPLETAIAPPDKALRSLDKIRNEHCGEYGPYLSAVEGTR